LGFQTDTIPIISCHGYIRLPVCETDSERCTWRWCVCGDSFS
jgi:hypothetical protein